MKCRFCGTNLPDDARFCSGCGREVERENVSAKEKNNNETEDAYYREIDDKEYEEIKKKKKEEERQREEVAKEEAERKLLEEKYAREEAERKRREDQRIMEESRRRYEEEQRRWKEFVKKQANEFLVDKEMNAKGIKILSIGRFCKAKNFDNVPEICQRIRERGMDITWYLIGFGRDEELIKRKIAEANMQEYVKIVNEFGGSMPDAIGVPEHMLKQASQMAVCKINIDSDLRLAMTASVRKHLAEHPDHFDPRQYLGDGRKAIQEVVSHKMREVLLCSGKA